MTHSPSFALVLGTVAGLTVGCTNEPGTLKFTLAPNEESYAPNEPIELVATLDARPDPVCLSVDYRLDAEVVRADGAKAFGPPTCAYCGNEAMGMMLLAPVAAPAALLDVGDALGRYVVVRPGQPRVRRFRLVCYAPNCYLLDANNARSATAETRPKALSPGQYTIRCKLAGVEGRGYPAPVFWKPYSHPVEAETTIIIAEAPSLDGQATRKGR